MASVLGEDDKEKQEKNITLFDTLDEILNNVEASDSFRAFLVPLLSDNQFIFLECLHSLSIKYGINRVIGTEELIPEDAPLVTESMAIFHKYIHDDTDKKLNFEAATITAEGLFYTFTQVEKMSDTKSAAEKVEKYNKCMTRLRNDTINAGGALKQSFMEHNLFGIIKEKVSSQLSVQEKFATFKNSNTFTQLIHKMTETHLPHLQWTAKPPNIAKELHTLRCCVRECLKAIHLEQTRERGFFEKAQERYKKWKSKNKEDQLPEKLTALYTLITSCKPFNIRAFREQLTEAHSFLLSSTTIKTTMYVYLDTLEKMKPLLQAITATLNQIPNFQQALDLNAQSTAHRHVRHAAVSTPTNLSPPSSTPSSARTSASTPSPSSSPALPSMSSMPATQPASPSPAGSMRRASAAVIFSPKPLGAQHRHRSSSHTLGNFDIQNLLKELPKDTGEDPDHTENCTEAPDRPSSATPP